jgi:hypothetical protein
MTTVQTRVREISDREGFDITVTKNGKDAKLRKNGVMKEYPFKRKLKDSATVADWRDRFEKEYSGLSCKILNGDGTIAKGQATLKTVRSTY